ncbi:MAG: hypothetical protein ABI910_20045 [Gemmatimonadota bacterium]
MPSYLYYDGDSDSVLVGQVKPADCTASLPTDEHFPTCRVWYAPQHAPAKVHAARALAALRIGPNAVLFLAEVKLACRELCRIGGPMAGYIGLGASVKLVKWWLASRNFRVVGINVSGVKMNAPRTAPFTDYLRSKVAELQGRRPFVVFDFVDDGHSLARIKQDLLEVGPAGTVVTTVAIGASVGRHVHEPDEVLDELEDSLLVKKMESQAIKTMTGRAKPKLPYPQWTPEANRARAAGAAKYDDMKERLKSLYGADAVPLVTTPAEMRALLDSDVD